MITDIHAHVIVPEITRGADPDDPWRPLVRRDGGGQVVEFGGRSIRSAVGEFVDVERMLAEAAAAGIERLVLSPWVSLRPDDLDPPAALRACRVQNDAPAAACAAWGGRVAALGAVPLRDPAMAVAELARLRDLGLGGVEVAASVGGASLGDDRFLPFWEAAEGGGAVVLVHPTTRGFDLPVLGRYYLWNTVGNPLETAVAGADLADRDAEGAAR